jgi:hypothetical protein
MVLMGPKCQLGLYIPNLGRFDAYIPCFFGWDAQAYLDELLI